MDALGQAQFEAVSYQLVMFTPDHALSIQRFMTELYPRWAKLFDGPPCVIPIADHAPAEVPRIVLASLGNRWKIEVAPTRFSFIWHTQFDGSDEPTAPVIIELGMSHLLQYREALSARANRLAMVRTRARPTDLPGTVLSKHFCKERWIEQGYGESSSFELHEHRVLKLKDQFLVNSWNRHRTARWMQPSGTRPVILVEQDINTVAEDEAARSFEIGELREFFPAARDLADRTMASVYPDGA